MNQGWAPYVAAIAASIAALLTLANLLRTARKEQLDWARSALQDAFVDCVTASYKIRGAISRIAWLRVELEATHREGLTSAQWRDVVEANHQTMLGSASRLRVLAPNYVAELALDLWHVSKAEVQLLDAGRWGAYFKGEDEVDEAHQKARDRFTLEAQKRLGIKENWHWVRRLRARLRKQRQQH